MQYSSKFSLKESSQETPSTNSISNYQFGRFFSNNQLIMETERIEGNKYCFLGCQLLFIETVGNIIQLFAFTGYQEDEVSGLKFAQARFYSAENGKFVETPDT